MCKSLLALIKQECLCETIDTIKEYLSKNVFRKLDDRGCKVLLTNSDTPLIRNLYSGYAIVEVDAKRAINCKGSKRAGHKELIIRNYSNT